MQISSPTTTTPLGAMVLGIAVTAMCAAAGCGPATRAEALAAAQHWAAQHPTGWSIAINETDPAHGLTRAPFDMPCINDFFTLRYAGLGTEIDLAFACPGPEPKDLSWLRMSFKFAALHVLPHNIVAEGWTFDVFTPISTFMDGVTFQAWEAGRLSMQIDTQLFGIDGQSHIGDCNAIADGPSSSYSDCSFRVAYPRPLRLTLNVPLTLEVLAAVRR
jgi:hypothetical protein